MLVAIVGGSGSGKTWLADRLARALPGKVSRISLDDFYRDLSHLSPHARARVNFDHPRAVDWACLEKVLRSCLAGHRTGLPRYDFRTHCRRPGLKAWRPRPIVICEGLWLLRRPALRRLFQVRIFLECPAALRLHRRLGRDVRARGRSPESVVRQFKLQVAPLHQRFVASQARRADLVLKSPVSAGSVRGLAGMLRKLTVKACPSGGPR